MTSQAITASPPNLTPCQQDAADALFRFLLSDEKEFSISGPAGVGKTFLMKYIMADILPAYQDACKLLGRQPVPYEIALTATTNKATEVLTTSTGFPATTIHSFMGLKVYDDYDTGNTKVSRGSAWVVHSRKLIFIDEASMIDSVLHKFIQEGTDKTCKIIYMGDHCQMAPVAEKLSPIYRTMGEAGAMNAQLKTQMRNANQPALMALCSALRTTVETMVFPSLTLVPGVIDHVDDAGAQDFLDKTFATENLDARVLCYTNARVNQYNDYIRNLRGLPAELTAGERVISNSAVTLGKIMIRVEEEFTVEEVSTPFTESIDDDDTEILVRAVTLINDRFQGGVKVRVPAEPDHFKNLQRHYGKYKMWKEYFHLKNGYADLRPRDAATVYKAQGSTYETVLIDLTNLGKCTDDKQIARMLYVAASRARNRIVFYGSLPKRLYT